MLYHTKHLFEIILRRSLYAAFPTLTDSPLLNTNSLANLYIKSSLHSKEKQKIIYNVQPSLLF